MTTILRSAALFAGFAVLSAPALAVDANEGHAVYAKANCVGCHKWHGGGGGGYGGAALSLRQTQLDREQIIQTIECGRPGTGMPYFQRGVYADDAPTHPCNDLTMKDLVGDTKVAEATIFLRPAEIQAVADYVVSTIKGKGEPTLAECVAFFGDASRACEIYKPAGARAMPVPSTTR